MAEKQPDSSETTSLTSDTLKKTLTENKGKLAIGVAATLGLMIFYKWREKEMAKKEPEDYARLKRLKASVKACDDKLKESTDEKPAKAQIDAAKKRQA